MFVRLGLKVVFGIADGAGGLSGGAEAADLVGMLIKERAASINSQADCERLLAELDGVVASNKPAGEPRAVIAVFSSAGSFGAAVGGPGAGLVNEEGFEDWPRNQFGKRFVGWEGDSRMVLARQKYGGLYSLQTAAH